ncbi:hypothetical protein B0H13DRAFT_2343135 [Mycena leptocephala]|nr:hypothetical protein B0H13DRAFT_2343135 [Mycena leptocephala]
MAIFVTCSAHWILTVIHFFRGFLGTPDIGSTHEYFAHDQTMTQVIRSALGDITLLIGDAVICPDSPIVADMESEFACYNLACPFVAWNARTSVYSTAFITWKVWTTSRAVKDIGAGPLMSVLAILVESAAIWTAWVIFFAVSYQTGSILQYLTAQLTPPIIGLFNMFIHLRVGLGWSHTQEPDRSMVAMTSSASIFRETVPAADSYDLEIIRAPHEADDV